MRFKVSLTKGPIPEETHLCLLARPDIEIKQVLEDRAKYGIIALIDPEKLEGRNREWIGPFKDETTFQTNLESTPAKAIQTLLVPEIFEDIVKEMFPEQEIIVVRNSVKTNLYITRKR